MISKSEIKTIANPLKLSDVTVERFLTQEEPEKLDEVLKEQENLRLLSPFGGFIDDEP